MNRIKRLEEIQKTWQGLYDNLNKEQLFELLMECISIKNKYDDIPPEILLLNSFYYGEELSKYELQAIQEHLNLGLRQVNKQLNDLKILEEMNNDIQNV